MNKVLLHPAEMEVTGSIALKRENLGEEQKDRQGQGTKEEGT